MTRARPEPKPRARSRDDGPSRTTTRKARTRTKREPPEKKPPARPDLRILQTQVFRGPNYYSYDPAIRLLVDLGSLEHWPSNTIKGFNEALTELRHKVEYLETEVAGLKEENMRLKIELATRSL
jgi:hypothetical protein